MDLLNRIIVERKKGKRRVIEREFSSLLLRGRIKGAFLSIWIEEEYRKDTLQAQERNLALILTAIREFKESSKAMVFVKTAEDFKKALESDGLFFLLSMEGLDGIGDKTELIYVLDELGVRMISLTWNNSNAFARGTYGEGSFSLTDLGKEAIKIMEELNLILDLAHLCDEAFWDALKAYNGETVVVSHTAVRSLCKHPRNLTDDMIKAIAERGGIIGIAAISPFISADKKATLSDFISHIKYISDLVGVEHVALGLDHECFLPQTTLTTEFPPVEGLECLEESANILHALNKEGFSQEEIEKIAHLNWERIILKSLSSRK